MPAGDWSNYEDLRASERGIILVRLSWFKVKNCSGLRLSRQNGISSVNLSLPECKVIWLSIMNSPSPRIQSMMCRFVPTQIPILRSNPWWWTFVGCLEILLVSHASHQVWNQLTLLLIVGLLHNAMRCHLMMATGDLTTSSHYSHITEH